MKSCYLKQSWWLVFAGFFSQFKTLAVAETFDLPKICDQVGIFNSGGEAGFFQLNVDADRDVFHRLYHLKSASVWMGSVHPSAHLRKLLFEQQVFKIAPKEFHDRFKLDLLTDASRMDAGQLLGILQNASEAPATYTPATGSFVRKAMRQAFQEPSFQKNLGIMYWKKARMEVCKDYPEQELCSAYIKSIAGWMSPQLIHEKTVFLSLPDLAYEIFTNSEYVQGAAIAALKILEAVESSQLESGQNLYDDLISSYRAAGLSDEKAEKFTWDFLGLYGSRGASLDALLEITSKESVPLMAAYYVISTGIAYLDAVSVKSGRLYSLPKHMQTNCNFGKAYHFWLPAYFARVLSEIPGNQKAAMSASYVSALGYEFGSRTLGRAPHRFFSDKFYGDYNNSIRINLAFHAAGAVFGAQMAGAAREFSSLNVDTGLEEIFNRGRAEPLMSEKGAENYVSYASFLAYRKWREMFAVDGAFNFYKKTAGF
jgi:hypothetical protein